MKLEKAPFSPPDTEAVVHRTLCLSALVIRFGMELVVQAETSEVIVEHQSRILDQLSGWLQEEGLVAHLTDKEEELLDYEIGRWSPKEILDLASSCEAVGILLWALGIFETLPHYDTEFSKTKIFAHLGFLRPKEELLERARLRPEGKLKSVLEEVEIWQWRTKTTEAVLRREFTPDSLYRARIQRLLKRAWKEGTLNFPLVRGDLPVFGKSYSQITTGEYSKVTSIVWERCLTFRWLCGYQKSWAEGR